MKSRNDDNDLNINEVATILWEAYTPCKVNSLAIPIGWNIIASTAEILEHDLYGLKSIALQNSATNKLCIAFAGTNLLDYRDLMDDLRIIGKFPPHKIEAIKDFLQHISEKIGGLDNFLKADIIFCGHSLGAMLAELAMFLVYLQQHSSSDTIYGKLKSMTIENPGSYLILKDLFYKDVFLVSKDVDTVLYELSENSTTYHSKQNYINTLHSQLASETYLQINTKNTREENILNTTSDHVNAWSLSKNFLGYIKEYMHFPLFPIKKCYSFYLVAKDFFKDHGLTYYIDDIYSLFLPVEQFQGPNNQIILNKHVLPLLKNIESTGKDSVIIIDDKIVDSLLGSFHYVEFYQYSYKDLKSINITGEHCNYSQLS